MARSHRIAGGHLQRCAIVAGFAMVDLVAHLGDSSSARLRVRHLVRVYLEPVALEPYLLSHGAICRGGCGIALQGSLSPGREQRSSITCSRGIYLYSVDSDSQF